MTREDGNRHTSEMLIADKRIQFWNITLRSQHFYKHFELLVSNELQIFRKRKSDYGPMEGNSVKSGAQLLMFRENTLTPSRFPHSLYTTPEE